MDFTDFDNTPNHQTLKSKNPRIPKSKIRVISAIRLICDSDFLFPNHHEKNSPPYFQKLSHRSPLGSLATFKQKEISQISISRTLL